MGVPFDPFADGVAVGGRSTGWSTGWSAGAPTAPESPYCTTLGTARDLGATHTVDAAVASATDEVAARIASITGGRGVDHVVETTADPGVVRTAVDALAVRGRCAVVGAPPAGTEVALDVQGLLTGKQVLGVTLGDGEPGTLLPRLVRLHAEGKLPLERLVRHYRPDQLNEAAEDMHHGKTVKPVVRFGTG